MRCASSTLSALFQACDIRRRAHDVFWPEQHERGAAANQQIPHEDSRRPLLDAGDDGERGNAGHHKTGIVATEVERLCPVICDGREEGLWDLSFRGGSVSGAVRSVVSDGVCAQEIALSTRDTPACARNG